MADTNTQILTPEKPPEVPVLSAEEQLAHANGQPGTKTIPTDDYIAKREEARRERKGGIKYKIDKLTKQTAEANKRAEEMAQKLAAVEQKTAAPSVAVTPAPVATVPVVDEKPDPRPKREDFKDDTEHTTAIAQWVVRQQNKIVASTTATPAAAATVTPQAPKEIQFNPQDPTHIQLKKEFDGFLFAGQDFIKRNPDFQERLNAAATKGLTLDNKAQRAIVRLAAPEVLYYLADPANENTARQLMNMDGDGQIVEIARIAERLKVKPSDYVSSAPKPGTHLTTGNTRATIPRDQMDPDDYIKMRIQERRSKSFRH